MARVRLPKPSSLLGARATKPIADDSPSRQLMFDLERALYQVQIHEAELQKVHAYNRRSFQASLDLLDDRKAQEDVAALEAVKIRHESVRREAEAELQQYYREAEEQDRLRRQKREEQRAREQQARAEAEAKRKAEEEAAEKARIQQQEAIAKKEAAEKQARVEEAERKKREALVRERAGAERKEREEHEAAKAAQEAIEENVRKEKAAHEATRAEQASQSQGQKSRQASGLDNFQHQRCLEIHQNLKKFRKEFWAYCKKDANLKSKVGDMRRGIKTGVGQLTEAKGANRQPTERIKSILKEAINVSSPPVSARDYLATVPAALQGDEASQCPSLLVYMLSIFSKAIISQFGGESGISIKAAEPAGVLVAHVFAAPDSQVSGNSLIDILLAKLHFACPVLWGVYGDEKTEEGRQLLGWRKEDGRFVTESRHHERVSGLGAGFAAIALRNFNKTRLRSPFPPTNFWECLANILNVPSGCVQPTHLLVLKAMLENSVDRFIQFYGSAAMAVLRHSLTIFPASLPPDLQNTAACKAITLLADKFSREKNLRLA